MGWEVVVVVVTNGCLDFGTWEPVFYGDFGGRRRKRVLVKIVGDMSAAIANGEVRVAA
jgi:thiamine phosphate synthase YjbQ (UPF0047 family)